MLTDLKEAIPIIGSGFNRWLCKDIQVDDQKLSEKLQPLMSWWALLEKICRNEIICPSQELINQVKEGGSTIFAWESLIYEVMQQNKQKYKAMNRAEVYLCRQMSAFILEQQTEFLKHIKANEIALSRMKMLIDHFMKHTQNIISLNFDTIIPTFLELEAQYQFQKNMKDPTHYPITNIENKATQKVNPLTIRTPSSYFKMSKSDRVLNIWYPHGHISHPNSMIVGFHRYTMSANYTYQAFSQWKSEPDLEKNQNTWVAKAIDQPLLLLGVGLSQEEVDIWEFLHLRARNQARLDHKRPVIRLTCDEENAFDQAHWRSLSKGLNIYHLNLGKTWDDAWCQLFKILN